MGVAEPALCVDTDVTRGSSRSWCTSISMLAWCWADTRNAASPLPKSTPQKVKITIRFRRKSGASRSLRVGSDRLTVSMVGSVVFTSIPAVKATNLTSQSLRADAYPSVVGEIPSEFRNNRVRDKDHVAGLKAYIFLNIFPVYDIFNVEFLGFHPIGRHAMKEKHLVLG